MRAAHIVLLMTLLAAVARSAQAAELVVIASEDPSMPAGTVIDGARTVTVAADATVVLVSADGRVTELAGPYSGAPDASPASGDGRLVESLSRLITDQADAPNKLAVFRGGMAMTPIGRPDVWGIDIARAGAYCVRSDRPAMLWWAGARAGAVVELTPTGDDAGRTRIRWPGSKKYAPWPDALPLGDGMTYIARFRSSDDGRTIRTLLMPELATDAHRAAWMAEKGCTRQALAVVDALREGDL